MLVMTAKSTDEEHNSGGGRCFGRDRAQSDRAPKGPQWARVVNQELLDLINSYEGVK